MEIIEYLNNSKLVAIIAFILPFIIFFRRYLRRKKTKEEKIDPAILEEKINQFKPDRLVKPVDKEVENSVNAISEENRLIIDLAKINYLNLLNNKEIVQNAVDCINKYGVGTCGARGFFGTTEVHIHLEKALSKFLGTEEAIVYAYGFTTITTAISAFCKQEDLVFCDEYVNFATKQGLVACKSETIVFKHNDVDNLKKRLDENAKRTKRKYLILEGIYEKDGTLCNLPEFVKLATLYKVRIFLDESISLGVIGINGKGLTEHTHVSISDIDLIIGSLENSLGSIGGFCAGSHAIIEYLRENSTSYIYTASLPTYLCEVAMKALPIVERNSIFLQILATKFQEFLLSIDGFQVISDVISPLKIFTYYNSKWRNRHAEECIYEYCRDNHVYVILNNNGITLHLNVELYFNEDRRNRIFEVMLNAVENINAKILEKDENIALLA